MRILLANANTTEAVTQACAAAARQAASPGTEILPVTARFGAHVIATRVENAIAAHAVLDCLAEHHAGCDAAILAVSYDTGLDAARQLLPMPVLGMTEAACLVACTQATRFGLVTFNQAGVFQSLVASHGLSSRFSGVQLTGGAATEMFTDPEGMSARVVAACERCVADGAEAVVLAGAVFAGLAGRLQPRAGVPLLDGIACATVLAEALVRLGLKRPTQGSLAAVPRETVGLAGPLATLLRGGA